MLHLLLDHSTGDQGGKEGEDKEMVKERFPLVDNTCLKQVEFNTFSCAGGTHANRVGDMHRYFTRNGQYEVGCEDCSDDDVDDDDDDDNNSDGKSPFQFQNLPENNTIKGITSLLAAAHAEYGRCRHPKAKGTAVLMVVQKRNFNVSDELPIECALWNDQDPPVPTYRVDWGPDLDESILLTDSGELLFVAPWLGMRRPVEISVAYLRAGYEAHEYDELGVSLRLRLESSRAIKCPSLLAHISTFKKVQQALALPGVLERFLSPGQAAKIRETFMPIYPLDAESAAGKRGREIATDPHQAESHILKPSLEGGGHNIYGKQIPAFLASLPGDKWSSYILMERIRSPSGVNNILMSAKGLHYGEVVSELGIFGACLWRRKHEKGIITLGDQPTTELDHRDSQSNPNYTVEHSLLTNNVAGWSFKTKETKVDEMSVVKGYGCFDTPSLLGCINE